jgi:hypothetical protein
MNSSDPPASASLEVPGIINVHHYAWLYLFLFFFAVLGFVIRAFTLSHSTSPIFVKGFSR